MRRRELIVAAGMLAIAPRLHAQPQHLRRIGILVPSAYGAGMIAPFAKRLASLGWVEGRNLAIELRNAEAQLERMPELAAELVRLRVDLLVTVTTPATRVVKSAAGTIPVVFSWVGDPVGSKFVASLARPGGNMTGLSQIQGGVAPKQFELLKALLPGLARAAQLHDPQYAGGLISYGANLADGFMRMAPYVDKILRGAKPADLPVEQADQFELVVNRRTAKELGLAIPQAVLLRATEVIE